jgi:Insulin/IGF/Relaxin family
MSPVLITSCLLAMLTIPSIFALPYRHQRLRKSCGKELNNRIFYICSKYGGFATLDDSLSTSHRRQKRGIVDECCKRACIDWDLRQYCNQNFVTGDASSEESVASTVEEHQQHKSEPIMVRVDLSASKTKVR